MVWGKDTQAKRDAQELDVRRKLMATEKAKNTKAAGKKDAKGGGKKK